MSWFCVGKCCKILFHVAFVVILLSQSKAQDGIWKQVSHRAANSREGMSEGFTLLAALGLYDILVFGFQTLCVWEGKVDRPPHLDPNKQHAWSESKQCAVPATSPALGAW